MKDGKRIKEKVFSDESIVVRQMGHTSIDCTKNHYYFNNKNEEDAVKQIEKAISY